jgi:hypothetical protein
MSIAFESEQARVQKLRDRLRTMSDNELIRFGKAARSLCKNQLDREEFGWQLREARSDSTH